MISGRLSSDKFVGWRVKHLVTKWHPVNLADLQVIVQIVLYLQTSKMMRKVGSILAVSGFNQISKRGITIKKTDKPPKILITGMS